MRLRKWIGTLFVLIILVIMTPYVVTATPYWAKPGVYVKYAALQYEPYLKYIESRGMQGNSMATMILLYNRSDILFVIHSTGDVLVTFKIIGNNGTRLKMNLEITAYNVTIFFMTLRGEKPPMSWNQSSVTSMKVGNTVKKGEHRKVILTNYKIKLKMLKISGDYWIRKRDGMVIDTRGHIYGHTFLWYDPTENIGSNEPYINLSPITTSFYLNGTKGLDREINTYYGTFGPPIGEVILVQKHPRPIKVCFSLGGYRDCPFGSGGGRIVGSFLYAPDSGITLTGSMLIPPADFRAIGVVYSLFNDFKGLYLNEVKRNYSIPPTLQLYYTNAKFQKLMRIPFSEAKTPLEFAFYASLIAIGLTSFRCLSWRRRRYSKRSRR